MEQQELQIDEQPLEAYPNTEPLTQAMSLFVTTLIKVLQSYDARITALEEQNG